MCFANSYLASNSGLHFSPSQFESSNHNFGKCIFLIFFKLEMLVFDHQNLKYYVEFGAWLTKVILYTIKFNIHYLFSSL